MPRKASLAFKLDKKFPFEPIAPWVISPVTLLAYDMQTAFITLSSYQDGEPYRDYAFQNTLVPEPLGKSQNPLRTQDTETEYWQLWGRAAVMPN